MTRTEGGRSGIACGILMAAVGLVHAGPPAVETRDFSITIDGKTAGSYQMTISAHDDSKTVVAGQANVKVTKLIFSYTYTYRGQEVWQGNRLQSLQSSSNDNGKAFRVKIQSDGDQLRVESNGSIQTCSAATGLTSYWHVPDARPLPADLTLVDADTGKVMAARIELVGHENVTVAGETQECAHYRISGETAAELWFDAQERLVREETVEDGHRTVLSVVGIRR